MSGRSCCGCGQPGPVRFVITQLDTRPTAAPGTVAGRWEVCSAACVVRWSVKFGQLQAQRLLSAAEAAYDQLGAAFRGITGK